MKIDSRGKGARAELDFIKTHEKLFGIKLHRNWQRRAGGNKGIPDVSGNIPIHYEVKMVEALNIWKAQQQVLKDVDDMVPVLVYRRSRTPWWISFPLDCAEEYSTVLLKALGYKVEKEVKNED